MERDGGGQGEDVVTSQPQQLHLQQLYTVDCITAVEGDGGGQGEDVVTVPLI